MVSAHHEFPIPLIPIPHDPPPSVIDGIVELNPSNQDKLKEDAIPDSPSLPPEVRQASRHEPPPSSSNTAMIPPSGTLPPQLLTLLSTVQSNLRVSFSEAPPHTAQRLAELLTQPRSHYRTLPSYLRALDRVVSVSSPATLFPLPNTTSAGHGSYLNGTMTPAGTNESDPDETLGGAALTPIPWLRETLQPTSGERMVGSDLRTESTSVIDGPNGVGSVETVTVAVNGNSRQSPAAVTQGELIRQEQEAGVVPVPMTRSTAPPDIGRRQEDADDKDVIPHARGPEVIGMEDMGPQATNVGFDVEAALGRKGEGETPALRKPPEIVEEKEADKEQDGDGDVEVVDADGNTEGEEKKANNIGQNVGCDAADEPENMGSCGQTPRTFRKALSLAKPHFIVEKAVISYGHEAKASIEEQLTLADFKTVDDSPWTWAFIGVSFIQAAIVLAFEAYAFAKFQGSLHGNIDDQSSSHTIPTFLALYIFGFLYQLLLVYDALRLKNTIQVIGLCIYNVGLLIYAAVQMDQIDEAIDQLAPEHIDASVWDFERPYLIAIPCIIGLGTVLMAVIAWKLYDEFAWTIYKHISADLKMKRRYLTYQ
ncbi:MAG: hypothetical protein Q9209_001177, partial [Squamulea sp. 1 TL-2023]